MRVAKRSDARISVMNELIQGIQVIKVRMFLNVLIFAVFKLLYVPMPRHREKLRADKKLQLLIEER